jgi:hypothetical protein
MKGRWGVIGAIALALNIAVPALSETPDWVSEARAIFAKHDRYGRLRWTRIGRLGDVRVGTSVYTIYNLYHVNEVTGSGHGMQQVSIIRNGRTFVGSYLDVSEPMTEIRGRTVFQKPGSWMKPTDRPFSFEIGRNGPPRKALLGGDFVTLESSI